jgi:uncharacterized RDD family membrane protein YckC
MNYDYYTEKPVYRRFPKVPLERRAWAFLIDFVTVWLISSLGVGLLVQWLIFIVTWFCLRVVVVDRNHGQSLGRWALDMKLLDARCNKIPRFSDLIKREAILGSLALLAMIGLNINFRNALSMIILISPLLADAFTAAADEEFNQAFHDRLAETLVIQSRRGFSLDLRLKKIVAQIRQNMRK